MIEVYEVIAINEIDILVAIFCSEIANNIAEKFNINGNKYLADELKPSLNLRGLKLIVKQILKPGKVPIEAIKNISVNIIEKGTAKTLNLNVQIKNNKPNRFAIINFLVNDLIPLLHK